jgi:hypothetical protein
MTLIASWHERAWADRKRIVLADAGDHRAHEAAVRLNAEGLVDAIVIEHAAGHVDDTIRDAAAPLGDQVDLTDPLHVATLMVKTGKADGCAPERVGRLPIWSVLGFASPASGAVRARSAAVSASSSRTARHSFTATAESSPTQMPNSWPRSPFQAPERSRSSQASTPPWRCSRSRRRAAPLTRESTRSARASAAPKPWGRCCRGSPASSMTCHGAEDHGDIVNVAVISSLQA